jgi:16S rRNA (guanine527-N7)-methyltransferase
LQKYVSLLTEWNTKVNLVSRADVQNIWFSHILHSITPLFLLEIPAGCSLVDLGSGGGLPGIPLAILRPDIKITLMDSVHKKTRALADIVQQLGLGNSTVITGRAEDLGSDPKLSGTFDGVVARAVAPLVDLIKWARPFLKKGVATASDSDGGRSSGRRCRTPFLLALKGGDLEAEVRHASVKQGRSGRTTVMDIAFNGSEELGLTEKKIVLVEFTLS